MLGIYNGIIKRKVFFKTWIILCMLSNAVSSQNTNDERLSPCELESLVNQLINPNVEFQMHAAALRNQLRNILQDRQILQSIDDENSPEDYFYDEKRAVRSFARGGIIPSYGESLMNSMAKSGMTRQSLGEKRSLANLAKNGQLPTPKPDEMDDSGTEADYETPQYNDKRNLGSLAKSGGLMSGKRNIGTIARDFQLPSNSGKRNLAAMARNGLVPKRNLAALARLNSFYNQGNKRNLGALKSSPVHGLLRQKRNMYLKEDYEIPNNSIDIEDLKNTLNGLYSEPYEEKRFLGSVAKNGWFRNVNKRNIGSLARLGLLRTDFNRYGASNSRDSYRQAEQKRHIGALARSGWLPSFRPVRSARFSRSERARPNIVGYFPQQERLRQPIAVVCRRCGDITSQEYGSKFSWGPSGSSNWGTPPRLTALHWRSLRPTAIGNINF